MPRKTPRKELPPEFEAQTVTTTEQARELARKRWEGQEPRNGSLNIRLPGDLLAEARQTATGKGETVTAVVERLLREYVKNLD